MQTVVISGKGGTGKTTLTASFAYLSEQSQIHVDADVDASNLHLMFKGVELQTDAYVGAKVARIDETCNLCMVCRNVCRYGALDIVEGKLKVNELKCEGCGACTIVCPTKAIALENEITGNTLVTHTEKGVISRAEMIPGAEGSGKLVTQVRKKAIELQDLSNKEIWIDGSPGIGCAVMASITNCDNCLLVTEPTQSGISDLKRVVKLVDHFGLNKYLVINKYDINTKLTNRIQQYSHELGLKVIGKIPFDELVETSINEGIPIVVYEGSKAGCEIREIYKTMLALKQVEV